MDPFLIVYWIWILAELSKSGIPDESGETEPNNKITGHKSKQQAERVW